MNDGLVVDYSMDKLLIAAFAGRIDDIKGMQYLATINSQGRRS